MGKLLTFISKSPLQFSRNITHMKSLAVGAASIRFNRRESCLVDPGNPSWEDNLTFIIFYPIGNYIHKWVSHHLFPFTTTINHII